MKGKFSIITTAIELVCMIVMKSYSNTEIGRAHV